MYTSTFFSFQVGDDYMITTSELIFQPSTDPVVCVMSVVLVEDSVLENTEMFSVLLRSSDENVVIDDAFSQITVEINDINGKSFVRI